jgi:MFS family permease
MVSARWLVPAGADAAAAPLLAGRALRAADGYVPVLLPAYLLGLGLGSFDVGLLSSATLGGSALLTLAVGAVGHRWPRRRLLMAAALLMAATGIAFAGLSTFWPLLLVAFIGTLNPSAGDVSLFLPLEQARLAEAARGDARTSLFARYSLAGTLAAASRCGRCTDACRACRRPGKASPRRCANPAGWCCGWLRCSASTALLAGCW